jgi:hypothetical protein
VESILESPELILRKQLDRVKSEKMFEMKMAGIEYEERMIELEKLEHPKPNRDFIYSTFNAFSAAHPWVGQENIRPKSVAREMYETFQSFAEYIRDYDLQRVEGILLRYLSEVFKVLEQTVPDSVKTDEVRAMAVYFGTMVRQTDSSLIDDWEKMRSNSVGPRPVSDDAVEPPQMKVRTLTSEGLDPDITRDKKAFLLIVRNEVHRLVRALANKDYESAASMISCDPNEERSQAWTAEEIERSLSPYFQEHQRICTDPQARFPQHTEVVMSEGEWLVTQTLVDPSDNNDWFIHLRVDLLRCKQDSRLVLSLRSIEGL